MERSEDGLDRVGGSEVSLEFGRSKFDAVTVFRLGDTVAEEDEPGAGWHIGGDVVEGGVGQEADRNVTVENWLDGAVFADEERLDVAAIDDGDGAVWFLMERYDGDVFASGDSGDEERIYRV